VFAWLHANAGQLGLDPARIGIKGESGGGGFAAAAVLYARDRQGPKFAFQHLIYPMIDDRTAVRKDLHPYVGEFVWTQENNYFGWRSARKLYLVAAKPGVSNDTLKRADLADASDCCALLPARQFTGLRKIKIPEKFLRRIVSPAIDSAKGKSA